MTGYWAHLSLVGRFWVFHGRLVGLAVPPATLVTDGTSDSGPLSPRRDVARM